MNTFGSNFYDFNSLFKVKKVPICKDCEYNKPGIDTFCFQYRLKPCKVVEGGSCEKYKKSC